MELRDQQARISRHLCLEYLLSTITWLCRLGGPAQMMGITSQPFMMGRDQLAQSCSERP